MREDYRKGLGFGAPRDAGSCGDFVKANPRFFKELQVVKCGSGLMAAFAAKTPFYIQEWTALEVGKPVKFQRGAIIVGENIYPNRKAMEQDGYLFIKERNPLERALDTLAAHLYQKLMNE